MPCENNDLTVKIYAANTFHSFFKGKEQEKPSGMNEMSFTCTVFLSPHLTSFSIFLYLCPMGVSKVF